MSINLEVPGRFRALVKQCHDVATQVLRANSRKYDLAEHEYPIELDMLASVVDGLNDSGAADAGASGVRRDSGVGNGQNRNGTNLSTVLSVLEVAWGDVALVLSMPRQGLGNSAIAALGSDGVQLLGGHGYVKEHPVERWYRDLRAIGLMEGAVLV